MAAYHLPLCARRSPEERMICRGMAETVRSRRVRAETLLECDWEEAYPMRFGVDREQSGGTLRIQCIVEKWFRW